MKEKSYMLAIPAKEEDLENCHELLDGLKNAADFDASFTEGENGEILLTVEYREEKYRARVYPVDFRLPEFYRCQHLFPGVDVQAIQKAESGLLVEMMFGDNAMISYHLQLKLIHAMLPDVIAVLDESSEKILSGHWVALAAVSQVPPAPRYLFTAQAVSGEEDCVWLHTHGLNRCGITELEVLDSRKETYNSHYNILETLANRLLEREEPLEPGEPLYLARLSPEVAVMVTVIPWKEALKLYKKQDKKGLLGGTADRKKSHNGNTGVVFVYPTKKDYEKGKYYPVSFYDQQMENNPIYWFSNAETARMKALAAERVNYMYRALGQEENHILVKIGLTIDEEFQEEQNTLEHIWFELLEAKDGKLTCRLTQEPYYVKDMHEGDVGVYEPENITDWLIYTPERRISPDDVYIMDL